MAKAEKVVATGLSEKSKIYTVKNKEEELRKVLDMADEEARQMEDKARAESDQIDSDTKTRVSEVENQAFESVAKKAEGKGAFAFFKLSRREVEIKFRKEKLAKA